MVISFILQSIFKASYNYLTPAIDLITFTFIIFILICFDSRWIFQHGIILSWHELTRLMDLVSTVEIWSSCRQRFFYHYFLDANRCRWGLLLVTLGDGIKPTNTVVVSGQPTTTSLKKPADIIWNKLGHQKVFFPARHFKVMFGFRKVKSSPPRVGVI